MDWRSYYKEHTMTPEQAVSLIHDGDRVVSGHAVGEPIIALHSTTKDESISKIVPLLTTGAPVTTSRCDVNYIVTEYGVAQLRGQTLRERAKRLIAIAHPKFRVELTEEYERRFGEKPSV